MKAKPVYITNFTEVGSGGGTTSTAEVRQHNYVNEITSTKDTTGGTPASAVPFTYDKNGNLLNDGVRSYEYDALNRVVQISDAVGDRLVNFLYDALNRRIQKAIWDSGGGMGGLTGDIPAKTTDYFYDGQQIIEERDDSTDTWIKVHFWGQYIDELMFFATNIADTVTSYRVLSDLLYRSLAMVTTDNVITEAYDTDAYGNTLCYSGPGTDGLWFTDDDVATNNPINTTIFTGREFDPESSKPGSSLYHYRARYYSPQIGRFLSRDPLTNAERRQGPNLYRYVGNNPPNQVDPSGLSQRQCCVAEAKALYDAAWKLLVDMSALASTFGAPGMGGSESPSGSEIARSEAAKTLADVAGAEGTGGALTLLEMLEALFGEANAYTLSSDANAVQATQTAYNKCITSSQKDPCCLLSIAQTQAQKASTLIQRSIDLFNSKPNSVERDRAIKGYPYYPSTK